jgi:hypothetical protein
MNERIRQLAEQANLSADKEYKYDYEIGFHIQEWDQIRLQKFARLIVEECAQVVTETRWHLPPNQHQIALGIKEHFGVKE